MKPTHRHVTLNRRAFIKTATGAAMSALGAPYVLRAQEGSKFDTVLLGSGWWGRNIARVAAASGQCRLTACCDPDKSQLDAALNEFEALTGSRPRGYRDFRELLEKEKPRLAIVATPDHWHPLIAIAAMKAGADVYVEKPIGHTVLEGRAMVKAARDCQRIVQVGTHRRVSPHNISAQKFLREGRLGKIGMVRAFVHYGGSGGKVVPDSEPPEGLDWDLWCGPAPLVPFNTAIHPKGFRKFLNFANGTLGDWGIHWMDQILWWTDEKWPKSVHSVAARHINKDNSDAPDSQVVTYEFDSFTCLWEHRQYAANNAEKHNVGCYFYGTEGTLHLGWLDGWTFYPSKPKKPTIHEDPTLHDPDKQNIPELWDDFLKSVRSRQLPVCDIEIGHRSTNMSLLGMLSAKLGRSIRWDGEAHVIPGDEEANRLLMRPYRKPWIYPS